MGELWPISQLGAMPVDGRGPTGPLREALKTKHAILRRPLTLCLFSRTEPELAKEIPGYSIDAFQCLKLANHARFPFVEKDGKSGVVRKHDVAQAVSDGRLDGARATQNRTSWSFLIWHVAE